MVTVVFDLWILYPDLSGEIECVWYRCPVGFLLTWAYIKNDASVAALWSGLDLQRQRDAPWCTCCLVMWHDVTSLPSLGNTCALPHYPSLSKKGTSYTWETWDCLSVLNKWILHKSLHDMNNRYWFTVDVYLLRTFRNILFFHVHFVMWHSEL